jgi:hypothetical protein
MSRWIADEADDLINLDHIAVITLNQPEDRSDLECEVLAINSADESYRLLEGSKEECESLMRQLHKDLCA